MVREAHTAASPVYLPLPCSLSVCGAFSKRSRAVGGATGWKRHTQLSIISCPICARGGLHFRLRSLEEVSCRKDDLLLYLKPWTMKIIFPCVLRMIQSRRQLLLIPLQLLTYRTARLGGYLFHLVSPRTDFAPLSTGSGRTCMTAGLPASSGLREASAQAVPNQLYVLFVMRR